MKNGGANPNPNPTISSSGGIYVSGIHTHIKFQHVNVTRGKGISSIRGGMLEMERCHIYGCKSSGLICRSGGTAELVDCELHDNQGSGVVSGESGTAVREREIIFIIYFTCIFFFQLTLMLCCYLLLLCFFLSSPLLVVDISSHLSLDFVCFFFVAGDASKLSSDKK